MRAPLARELRSQLEKTVIKARDIAEQAAREELKRLSVDDKTPANYLNVEQRSLRKRLRAHGRQLGDHRNPTGEQSIEHLVTEAAYEHWHRMLFARFLAENNLLMYEDGVTALAIQDCFDLAEEETGDSSNGWQYAANYAAKMLPQIFRVDSPVFDIDFAPNHQKQLEQLLADLAEETFQAQDSLGWVYQFWQSKKKDEVNAAEVKIGADELPAVTQLFTEPYMVSFLLDNSLGAWWAARSLSEADLKSAGSEEELRRKAAIPGVPLEYLRFVKQADGAGNTIWSPAAGSFDAWPEQLGELKILDPCCGSGHFLVTVFLMLVPIRMVCDGLSSQDAVDAVLRENIHGLELDERCVKLAAFSLALTAWKYPGEGKYRPLPEFNLACSGLAVNAKKEDWLALTGDNTNLGLALEELYNQFKEAPVLGSLIDPEASLGKGSLFELKWEEVSPLLTNALAGEKDDEITEMGVVAHGVIKAASLLAQKYDLVMTNFPFVGVRKQTQTLRDYCNRVHFNAKHDLSTCLIDRCKKLLNENGTIIFVSPHNWLFLGAYKAFRAELLRLCKWNLVAFMGHRSFQTPMYDFSIALSIITNSIMSNSDCLMGVNVEEYPTPIEKADGLCRNTILSVKQSLQLQNPDHRITLIESSNFPLLQTKAVCLTGAMNGDSPKFLRQIWEFGTRPYEWIPLQSTVTSNTSYGGRQQVIYYDRENGHLREDPTIRRERLHNSDERGNSVWNKIGIMVHRMGSLPVTIYDGEVYDQNGAAIVPNKAVSISALWCFLASSAFNKEVRRLDNKVGVTPATLAKVPFDIDHWSGVAEEEYPNGLPEPYSDDPTQWIFHGHPCGSVLWDEQGKWTAHGTLRSDDTVLDVAVDRLLGYQWPAELDSEMNLADEQHDWVEKCKTLSSYVDDDSIVCIPAVRGEKPAHERLVELLQAAYGSEWSTNIRNKLLEKVGCKNKTVDVWLREKYFEQHCKLFQHRPFIWHIWDGLKDGFAVLVNYHKLDKKNLERLIYTYLDDWIRTQNLQKAGGVDGATERLAAAENLKQRLELILEGEAPYDIFVRWKPLEEQSIGWDPNINDGVRLNIRPFMSVADVGKKGAGILRAKPNIHWKKDRGKDVESAPWYKLGLEYGGKEGDRINDHHLSLEERISVQAGD